MRPSSTPRAAGPLTRLPAVLVLLVSLVIAAGAPAGADERAPSEGAWPLDPRPEVVGGFHPPATRWGPGHRGVDLAGRAGQPVRAAAPGRVSFAGRLAGRGVVVVDHGGTRTTYEPVSAAVPVGDRVAAGTVLGRLEVFGSHCFPRSCLHWGLIEGAEHYLDPLTLVGAGPVRLLPLDGSLTPALRGPALLAPPLPQPRGPRGSAALVRGAPPG